MAVRYNPRVTPCICLSSWRFTPVLECMKLATLWLVHYPQLQLHLLSCTALAHACNPCQSQGSPVT